MALLDKRIEVRAPPQAVFEFLAHVERMPRWKPGELRVARLTEARGKGAVVHHETEACGTRLSMDAVIEDWQPGKRLAWRQQQGDWARNQGAWELKATKQGTVVRIVADLELPHTLDVEVTAEEAALDLSHGLDMALLNLKDELEG
ncbi:MAG TPA: SRPBCC family protein [Candidatus Thermoplasmatota archaeon]|jgi:uncharacterized protein YndB with AHSA1/START domain|nr:SRPBCC family protein [Candidatus Thermoplasmatota archaeon]